ncbi:MAG TPA: 2-succinyl-5-enolpyruvyl-6-hydroxy-3-cyclohexene-1-carboxylic-acid synthase [Lapillicoccus sp.]|uniref:2-succinyl-5-enolpyruvyl-6-hydroxy-3- cyclohexene-1-carboxylic-acid synthase n=1 Tax=Lapillicoccus sp. TaxID=1909287 RepID=UPI002F9469A7
MRSSERAAHLLAALVSGGVREVVLAPGSRSAGLALALYAADAAGDVRLHVRVDERTAGFLALGLAAGSRTPVAVVTTSGTAVGNLLPAVMEASHSGRRLVVLAADRPAAMRGSGANQTTRQDGIFGVFAPCFDLGVDASSEELAAAAAVATRRRGPTHLNVQLEEPLLPESEPWWPPATSSATSSDTTPATFSDATSASADIGARRGGEVLRRRAGVEVLRRGKRTVVVAGDDAGSEARILAERAGWPLLAEPTSGARVGANAIRTYRLLLGGPLADEVERVVVLGHPTLSRPVARLISSQDVEVLAAPGPGGVVTDPGRVARHLGDLPTVDDAGPTADDTAWLEEWRAADRHLSARLDLLVDELPELDGLHVAREVAASVGPHATLVAGSSNPVRDLDLMTTPYPPHGHRFVVGNRGLSGIDGTVSTAVGIALGRRDASRTLALLGDVTFLHDANGLVLGPDEPRPDLTLVVVNDDGGSIFATLEQGSDPYGAAFERVFGTPHGVDLGALCRATGTAYTRVDSVSSLRRALADEPRGMRVVEARVDRSRRRATAAAITALATAQGQSSR